MTMLHSLQAQKVYAYKHPEHVDARQSVEQDSSTVPTV
jgi:hypothetical protein